MIVRIKRFHQQKDQNEPRWDEARATEMDMLHKLRTMSAAHKAEVKKLKAENAALERTVAALKACICSLEQARRAVR